MYFNAVPSARRGSIPLSIRWRYSAPGEANSQQTADFEIGAARDSASAAPMRLSEPSRAASTETACGRRHAPGKAFLLRPHQPVHPQSWWVPRVATPYLGKMIQGGRGSSAACRTMQWQGHEGRECLALLAAIAAIC